MSALSPCRVCQEPTDMRCSDCAIDGRTDGIVCAKTACRDAHESLWHRRPDIGATIDEGIGAVLDGRRSWTVAIGDCINVLHAMPDACADAVVTDPPAGIGFMNKSWDGDKGGRGSWVAWMTSVMRDTLRILKPGAHALVWALPRTSHWTATAIEDAGFEIRDVITHHFGSGFPKSLDVSKAIDAAAGAARPVVGVTSIGNGNSRGPGFRHDGDTEGLPVTAPATSEAEQWSGWGTALKPASEHWILARKPLIGTVAANVLAHETGSLNIDACRIRFAGASDEQEAKGKNAHESFDSGPRSNAILGRDDRNRTTYDATGRWPANLILSHADGCRSLGTKTISSNGHYPSSRPAGSTLSGPSGHDGQDDLPEASTRGETVEAWECVDGCPIAELDRQSANAGGLGDSGGASRFFYCPKPATAERESGLSHLPRKSAGELVGGRQEGSAAMASPRTGAGRSSNGRANHHPTVKSVDLMRWLCRLITPPKGIIVDMFAGSGSTGIACSAEGFRFIGIERDAEYAEIARLRIEGDAPLFAFGERARAASASKSTNPSESTSSPEEGDTE